MSEKKSRHGEIVAVRYATQPVYEGNTLIGSRTFGNVTVKVTDEGPDHGRLVHVRMEPEEMLIWAHRMIDVAGETQMMRADIGHHGEES